MLNRQCNISKVKGKEKKSHFLMRSSLGRSRSIPRMNSTSIHTKRIGFFIWFLSFWFDWTTRQKTQRDGWQSQRSTSSSSSLRCIVEPFIRSSQWSKGNVSSAPDANTYGSHRNIHFRKWRSHCQSRNHVDQDGSTSAVLPSPTSHDGRLSAASQTLQ